MLITMIVTIIIGCEKEEDKEPTSYTDTRDGKTYEIVRLGTQTWFAENLNYKIGSSKCYENETSNCDKYGRLYDWNTAMNACPEGWHLPDDEEWKILEMYLGMSKYDADLRGMVRGTDEGTKIKSISGWFENRHGTDSVGFNAKPSGWGMNNVYFSMMYKWTNWWTSTGGIEYGSDVAFSRYVWASPNIGRSSYLKTGANYSVRCLKD